jgi:hypothetical protein
MHYVLKLSIFTALSLSLSLDLSHSYSGWGYIIIKYLKSCTYLVSELDPVMLLKIIAYCQ